MGRRTNAQYVTAFSLASNVVLGWVFMGSLVICAGWILNVPELKKMLIGPQPVQSSTALGLLLSTIGATLMTVGTTDSWWRRISKAIAIVLILSSGVTLVEQIAQKDFGTEIILFPLAEGASHGLSFPGPMAPNVSFNFFLIGLALLLPNRKIQGNYVCQMTQLLVAASSMMALIGHILNVDALCTMIGCIKMPLMGSVFFLLTSMAILFNRPQMGITQIFTQDSIGGELARRLSCVLLAVPVLLWFKNFGELAQWFDPQFGWAAFAVLIIALLGISVGANASKLHESDVARREAESKANETSQKLSELYESQLLNQSAPPRRRMKNICLACEKVFAPDLTNCPDDGTRLSQLVDESLVGTLFAEKYEVIDYLGSGGMSTVYRARQVLMDKIVAIKVLQKHMMSDPSSVKRFQLEAKAASNLNHPNLINVSDFGVSVHGEPFMVMEYLEGITLDDLLHKLKRLDVDRFIEIFEQVCAGLACAHQNNVIHRDIKPGNIMLTLSADDERVLIVDFGLAKLLDERGQKLTQTGEVFGSPLYMSPEQCLGNKLDARTDIYSLGCVMYECLAGFTPFRGETAIKTISMQVDSLPKPFPAELRLPKPLQKLILQMLEKMPDDRPQKASDIANVLKSLKKPSHIG